MAYNEDDYLQLSGIQHFKFCRRQWALIHIERQWAENLRTVDGEIFHHRAHDGEKTEKRGDTVITRDMRIFSPTLGISGACDVVEFQKSSCGVAIMGMEGLRTVFPIEYKNGKPKGNTMDALQLCAQAMCLEEMLCCEIPKGALFYGETRHRESVAFTQELRQEVRRCVEEMHALQARGCTPKVKPTKSCKACSLEEICVPKLMRTKPVREYVSARVEETL